MSVGRAGSVAQSDTTNYPSRPLSCDLLCVCVTVDASSSSGQPEPDPDPEPDLKPEFGLPLALPRFRTACCYGGCHPVWEFLERQLQVFTVSSDPIKMGNRNTAGNEFAHFWVSMPRHVPNFGLGVGLVSQQVTATTHSMSTH